MRLGRSSQGCASCSDCSARSGSTRSSHCSAIFPHSGSAVPVVLAAHSLAALTLSWSAGARDGLRSTLRRPEWRAVQSPLPHRCAVKTGSAAPARLSPRAPAPGRARAKLERVMDSVSTARVARSAVLSWPWPRARVAYAACSNGRPRCGRVRFELGDRDEPGMALANEAQLREALGDEERGLAPIASATSSGAQRNPRHRTGGGWPGRRLTFCRVSYTVFRRTMALEEGNLAQNVRRLAGMHLASMDKLAQYIGISRQTMQAIVAHDPEQRSLPRADTVIKIAEAFGISLDALYREPVKCLREALEHFEEAPIREVVDAPSASFKRERVKQVLRSLSVTNIPQGQKRQK